MSAAEQVNGTGPGRSAGSLDPKPPLVVGLGPVGLTLALGFARAGIRSIAIDRKSSPDQHSRATRAGPVRRTRWRSARIGPSEVLIGYSEERTHAFDRQVQPLTNGIELLETLPPFVRSTLFATVGLLRRTPLPRVIANRLSMID